MTVNTEKSKFFNKKARLKNSPGHRNLNSLLYKVFTPQSQLAKSSDGDLSYYIKTARFDPLSSL